MNDWREDGEAAAAHAMLELLPHHTNLNKDTNMKLSDAIDTKYLQKEDVDGDVTVTVESVKKQNVAKEDEPPEYKLVVKVREFPKPFIANKTNTKRLFKALGDDSDDWAGQQIVLFVDPDVEFGGKVVGGLRLRAMPRSGTMAKATPRSDADINRDLNDTDIPF